MRYWRPLMVTLTWAMASFRSLCVPASGEGQGRGLVPVGCNDGPDGAHRLVDPAHRLSITAFKLARAGARRIKFGREPRAINVEHVNLLGEPSAAPEPLLQRGIERIKRIGHTFDGLIELGRAARNGFWFGHILTASIWWSHFLSTRF